MTTFKWVYLSVLIASFTGSAWSAPGEKIAVQLLTSGTINLASDTLTVPLHQGRLKDGRSVWYVLLDASDSTQATAKGLVYAPGLTDAANAPGTRTAAVDSNGEWVFDRGRVDFSANRSVTPGAAPDLFPPKAASPGSVGDMDYSPYVRLESDGGAVYNAPIVAFNVNAAAISFCGANAAVDHAIVHDKVVSICPDTGMVTLALSHGFSSGKPMIYVSLDANDPVASALEGATYAPALNSLKETDATLPLFAVTNGQTGKDNPNRQGFDSALMGDGSPLNVLTGIPTLSGAPYSPLWDIHIAEWTSSAAQSGKRVALTSAQEFSSAAKAGLLTAFGGGSGLPSSGLLVNCPAVAILQ